MRLPAFVQRSLVAMVQRIRQPVTIVDQESILKVEFARLIEELVVRSLQTQPVDMKNGWEVLGAHAEEPLLLFTIVKFHWIFPGDQETHITEGNATPIHRVIFK